MNRRHAAALLTAVLLSGATACGTGYTQTGTVHEKETEVKCKLGKPGKPQSCTTTYEIDLIKDDGTEAEVHAHSREHYDRCDVGERFPECTDGKPQ